MKKNTFFNFLFIALLLMGSVSVFSCKAVFNSGSEKGWEKLAPVELDQFSPSNFDTEEWYMPYYLKHFSTVANSIIDSGPNKGYIDISVWRSEAVNHPYDARIMENIVSLAWFYTRQRDWNIYYNDPALKVRLEAALTFWCNMQNEDGRFSEYDYNRWSLAPTAFATKFVGRALSLLADGESKIEAKIFDQAVASWRKALYVSFTKEDLWEHGRNFTNQFANLWGGALMYLDHWPDPELEQLFRKRLQESVTEFQSPCGFFYEKGGPDWGYNLSTHHSDLHVAWHYARGTDLHDVFVEKTRYWYDWFSYNALKEPGSNCFYLNRAVETRQQKGFYEVAEIQDPAYRRWVPQAEFVKVAQAFEFSKEELEASEQKRHNEMTESFPSVAPLQVGQFRAFSPYAFVHEGLILWHPTQAQKNEAIENLPYLKNDRFTQIRFDNRSNTSYAFVRRPPYYTTFNSGGIITEQQRYGIGLIWNPVMGTVFQSQSRTNEAAYGTKAESTEQVYEASDLFPKFKVNDTVKVIQEPKNDLDADSLVVTYLLGRRGDKTIRFHEDKISVSVNHPGKFSEIIPLLVGKNDHVAIGQSSITLNGEKGQFVIHILHAKLIKKTLFQSDLKYKQCFVFEVEASEKLDYEMKFQKLVKMTSN